MSHHHHHHHNHHNHHHHHHHHQGDDQGGYYDPPQQPPVDQYSYYPPPNIPPPMPSYGGYQPPPGPPPRDLNNQYGGYGFEPPIPVPHHAQDFHPELGSRYQFQYSRCTGRRKALLIGINYIGTRNELRGCINDVMNISQFLQHRYRFSQNDMVILRDDNPPNPAMYPSRANMLRAMHWLVDDARPHDSLFFHYSGHGGQMVDINSYQDDIFDETIYPVDFDKAGPIINNEMHDIMVSRLPPGCRLTAIFDCCHSGSALSLPYEYGANGLLKEPNIMHEAGRGFLDAAKSYQQGDLKKVFEDGASIIKSFTRTQEQRDEIRRTRTHPADVIQLSGCKNYQTSADAVEGGRATGAMSWAFREVLIQQPRQSYNSLLVNVRDLLATKYEQKPVFSSSHPVDTRLEFIL